MDATGGQQDQGRLIGGRYRLAERIGAGGMGTVWRAVDELVGRDVAVKQPRLPGDPHGEAQQRAYARLRREARAAAGVDHPSAVTVHDVVVEDDLPWIVMELVRGESLHELLARGPLAPPEAARIGLAVLGALRAAHAKGILHRDVKPANVLLGPHGRVVLTDFGIAHIQGEESLTVSGEFVGSLESIAPERMSGDGAGPASDLWSLGVLLYAAVEGWSPFRRTTLESTLAAILSFDPPAPERAGALGPLIARLIVRDPAMRPDAAEVAEELTAALDPGAAPAPRAVEPAGPESEPVAPRPEPDPGLAAEPGTEATRSAAPVKSRRTPALLAAALAGALLVGGGVWLGTSLGAGSGDGGAGAEYSEGSAAPPVEPSGKKTSDRPSASPSASAEKGWTTREEPGVHALIPVPDKLTDVYHDPSDDGVRYTDPKSDVTLSLKRWTTGTSTAFAWATGAGDAYAAGGATDITKKVTRTTFHGMDAAELDITYRNANDDAVMREKRLYVVGDQGRYDFGVSMPEDGGAAEKQGTDVYAKACAGLQLEKS